MDRIAQLNAALAARYSVESELGVGGMATVYLAKDLRHHRHVAVKVLNPDLGAVVGAERFLSEIRVTANLQHPNLLPLFDSGDADDGAGGRLLYYVMPYIEGESLRDRLAREKQLPVDDAIRIAVAVAGALEYAHKRGVIHRDLKPENILLQAGQPVVADFGIALAVAKAGGARVTQTGISVGTPRYMSPEQATGDREVDARSDVYSLAVVVYEMLTGEPPHSGSTAQALMSRLLTERPRALRDTRPAIPEHVDAAVSQALEKLPADRFTSAARFATALEDSAFVKRAKSAPAAERGPNRLAFWLGVALLVVSTLLTWTLTQESDEAVAAQFFVEGPRSDRFVEPSPALSPDGRHLVLVSADSTGVVSLWLRPIDGLVATRIPGTENAEFPFWSPKSDAVAFFSDGKLRIAQLSGGPISTVCAAPRAFGGTWNRDGVIVFSPDLRQPLYRVAASGGTPVPIGARSPAFGSRSWPSFLADGRHFVYLSASADREGSGVYLAELGDTTATRLRGLSAVAVANDHLLFVELGGLKAQRLDVIGRRLTGPIITIADGVASTADVSWTAITASENGLIAYRSGGLVNKQLTWFSRSGTVIGRVGPVGDISAPALSPDGRAVAFGMNGDLWVADLARKSTPTRFTVDSTGAFYPAWSPDGRYIAFTSNRSGAPSLYVKASSGAGEERLLTRGIGPFNWTAAGLTYFISTDSAGDDAYLLRLGRDTTAVPFLATRFNEYEHRLSNDGMLAVYVTEESGTPEVWLTTFPASDTRLRVSTAGGVQPIWSRDDREITYLALDGKIMAVNITRWPKPRVDAPRPLFQANAEIKFVRTSYQPSADGQRILVNSYLNVGSHTIVVLTNTGRLLKR